MTIEKHESLNFYNYLCQKIGSEEVVKVRRLALVINDIGQNTNRITSGSKGEGLDLKGSDIDVMTIDCNIEVIESEKDFDIKHQKFNTNNKEKIITILTSFYRQGIDCFASSETLQDYRIQSNESTESLTSRNSRLLQQMIPTFCTVRLMLRADRVLGLLFTFLHSSRTGLSRVLFALLISEASLAVADTHLYHNVLGNKHYYFKYMHCLSHLTIGLDIDALSGLLKLASFLYVHKKLRGLIDHNKIYIAEMQRRENV
ncbi:unnamed protein product [Mytilus edulis]|uniref:Uncharacterized protein n=1 Tax=Mytilus edulis TaxID=6550 RepID=A0A8S3SJY3_MYTED|nr:unnamed protein product [Mytilus edulis]